MSSLIDRLEHLFGIVTEILTVSRVAPEDHLVINS